jgi:hypothetical protein
VGDESSRAFKPVVTADEFAENILGFEEVEEGDEEEALADNAPTNSQFGGPTGMSGMRGVPDMIPEENEQF